MDITPIYELRSRLRAAAIAGTNLLSEDFRLKRAVEAIQPLEAASPVFAKIGELARGLLSSEQTDREGALLDTITLVDALLCTQGEVTVAGELQPLRLQSAGSAVSNAPYSDVKAILDALQNSGGGRYGYVKQTHDERPELFEDYRVKPALVRALGASYAELAEDVKNWLKDMGEPILPLLEKDFDPKGKKEMLRRVEVIDAIAGAGANDFYLKYLPDSEKEIRQALIYALRHSPENLELLLSLVKTEKGKAKKMAYMSLACQESEEARACVAKWMEKKPEEARDALGVSGTDWASEMVREGLFAWADQFEARLKSDKRLLDDAKNVMEELGVLNQYLEALCGANGETLAVCCRRVAALANAPKLQHLALMTDVSYGRADKQLTMGAVLGRKLSDYLMLRPNAERIALMLELYQTYRKTATGEALFPAAAQAMLLGEEDGASWYREEATYRGWLKKEHAKDKNYRPYALEKAFEGLYWDNSRKTWVIGRTIYRPALETREEYVREVRQRIKGEFTEFLMEIPRGRLDSVLSRCIPKGEVVMGRYTQCLDEEYTNKVTDYFYQQALKGLTSVGYSLLLQMYGYPKCEGLAVQRLGAAGCNMWDIKNTFHSLPGDAEAKRAEGREVLKRIKSGKIDARLSSGELEQIEIFLETLE